MATRRELPKSHIAILKALMMAKSKNDSIPVINRFLSAATEARLNAMEPLFTNAMNTCSNELAAQTLQTALVNEAFDSAQLHISHFFQVFDLGVKRKKFPSSSRAFYGLDVNSKKLPRLRRASDIKHWGDKIEAGDASRMAGGGVAMSNPTAVEVKTPVDDFRTKDIAQSNLKDAFHRAQKELRSLMPQARKVIRKVWDEVETFYNEDKTPSRRRKAREWGIVYVSDVELTFDFSVTGAENASIDEASIVLEETGNTVLTSHGAAQMKSQVSDFATFFIKYEGYKPHTVSLELPHGKTEYQLGVKLEKL